MDLHGAHMIATKGKVKNRPKPYSLILDLLLFLVPNTLFNISRFQKFPYEPR